MSSECGPKHRRSTRSGPVPNPEAPPFRLETRTFAGRWPGGTRPFRRLLRRNARAGSRRLDLPSNCPFRCLSFVSSSSKPRPPPQPGPRRRGLFAHSRLHPLTHHPHPQNLVSSKGFPVSVLLGGLL